MKRMSKIYEFSIFGSHENNFITLPATHGHLGLSTLCSGKFVTITCGARSFGNVHVLTVPNERSVDFTFVIFRLDRGYPTI
jgi:hypothetical protein